MAEIIVWVDLDVVGGLQDGSTQANAYPNFRAAYLASVQSVATGDSLIFECRGSGEDSSLFDNVTELNFSASGYVFDTGAEVVIRSNGPDFPSKWDNNNYSLKLRNNYLGIRLGNLKDLRLNNIQIRQPSTADGASLMYLMTASIAPDNIVTRHCVMYCEGPENPTAGGILRTPSITKAMHWEDEGCLYLGKYAILVYASGSQFTHISKKTTFAPDVLTLRVTYGTNPTPSQFEDCIITKTIPDEINRQGISVLDHCAVPTGTTDAQADLTTAVFVDDFSLEFVNPANYDYTLQTNSQLLGAGKTGNNIGVDQVTVAANQPPVANDNSFSISSNIQNGNFIGTYTATDSDGTVVSYSIDNPVLAIDNSGVITMADNSGVTVGVDITATVTATDNEGAIDTGLITITVTEPFPTILSVTPIRLGEQFTITVDSAVDLTTRSVIRAYIGGVSCGNPNNINTSTVTFNAPIEMLDLSINHNLVLKVSND